MRLGVDDARNRLLANDHGVLGTVHAVRGVDLVPVVYAVDGDRVGVPIDRVKPKAGAVLRRERNLADDPRASLLVEGWDRADWSQLWWVRAELRWEPDTDGSSSLLPRRAEQVADLLAARFPQYHERPFARVLVFRIVGVSGWSGAA